MISHERELTMLRKHKLLIAAGTATVLSGLTLSGMAAAQSGRRESSLVDALTNRFHLNRTEVQQVFDQQQSQWQQEREQRYQAMLQQAVTDGTLTTAQKDLLTSKHQELEQFRQTLKDKSPADRRTALQQEHQQLQDWATQNNIPARFLMPFGGHHGGTMMDHS
jgi:hypothetical protein